MVDYNINVPSIQPMQQPNMMQAYGQMQQIQANRMLMQDREREQQESNALRELMRGGNIDFSSPEGMRKLLEAAPKSGAPLAKALLGIKTEERTAENQAAQARAAQAQTERTLGQIGADKVAQYRNGLATLDPADPNAYGAWYKVAAPEFSKAGATLPPPDKWNAQTKGALLQTADSFLASTKYKVGTVGGRDVRYRESGGPAEEILVQEAPFAPQSTPQRDVRFEGVGQGAELPDVRGTVPVGPGAAAPGDAQAVINNMRAAPAQNVNQLAGRLVPASQLAAETQAKQAESALQADVRRAQVLGEAKTREAMRAKLPLVEDTANEALSQIEGLIGGAKVNSKGQVVYERGAKQAHPGFESAIGASISKLFTEEPVSGTSRADFVSRLKQLQGGAFLEAYNTLRGGGAITEKEGEKATAARNRMNVAQSEGEFISAAREYENIIRTGVARAKAMAQGTVGAQPSAPPSGERPPLSSFGR